MTDTLPHKRLFTTCFDDATWERIIDRLEGTTIYDRSECERMMNECLAYLIARAHLENPNDVLVANLLPDQAWHVFIHFTQEYSRFCELIAGTYLHHDPAEETALVNNPVATRNTVEVMERHGIEYDPYYWRDYKTFPFGAEAIPTGVLPKRHGVFKWHDVG